MSGVWLYNEATLARVLEFAVGRLVRVVTAERQRGRGSLVGAGMPFA